jgi:response regulator RpfG family c-di-GMP phosphodiesterase
MTHDDPLGQRAPRQRPTIAGRLEQPPYSGIAAERLAAHAATLTASDAIAVISSGDDGAAAAPHVCSVPIMIGDTTYGALVATRRHAPYTSAEEKALTDIADLLGLVVEHAGMPAAVRDRTREQTAELAEVLELRSSHAVSKDVEVGLATAVAEALGLGPAAVIETELAVLVQDVGSLGVPQDVLDKGERVDAEERALLAQVPAWSAESVARVPGLEAVALVVLHCRDRWDSGERTPIESRIVNACAAYRAAASAPLESLRAGAGTRFDPAVVDALEAIVRDRQAPIT